jgi:SAM-dependent methyltransferase
MTKQLEPLCKTLFAVDFVPEMLSRARLYCSDGNVTFAHWDLKTDCVLGQFDLIVIIDVLCAFGGRRDVSIAIHRLANALTPGGYLLYGDYIGDITTRSIQDGLLGRLLLFHPNKIYAMFSKHPELLCRAYCKTDRHVLTLFQKGN